MILDGNKDNTLAITGYEATNNLMFDARPIERQPIIQDKNTKKIYYENIKLDPSKF